MRIGVLTGGGDCPGLNAAIRGVVKKALQLGWSVVGIHDGWAGLIQGRVEPMTEYSIAGILARGGTILGTSRTNPFKQEGDVQRCADNMKRFGIDALVAIGGEDTLGVAAKFFGMGWKVVGVPKTIDNDLSGTDYTFGFDTAVFIATDAIDRCKTTAEAHRRVMVVEVMGRHAGWIATFSGLAGGADVILIPEQPFDIAQVCEVVQKRQKRGKLFSLVVVAEGAHPKEGTLVLQDTKKDSFGHVRLGGIGNIVGSEIEKRTGIETRVTILGHIQRGGAPTATDRIRATRLAVAAVELAEQGRWGHMTGIHGNDIGAVLLSEATSKIKTVTPQFFKVAEVFFG
ncbi:MAG: 6-phosphofructokinase [Planctomycetes bacterium]|nr:6-phosphofructokinase [Planctomycetota bacterium]